MDEGSAGEAGFAGPERTGKAGLGVAAVLAPLVFAEAVLVAAQGQQGQAAAVAGFGEFRVQGDGFVEAGQGFGQPVLLVQRVARGCTRPRRSLGGAQCSVEAGERFVGAFQPVQRVAAIHRASGKPGRSARALSKAARACGWHFRLSRVRPRRFRISGSSGRRASACSKLARAASGCARSRSSRPRYSYASARSGARAMASW